MRNKNDSVSSRAISIIIACVVVLPPFLLSPKEMKTTR